MCDLLCKESGCKPIKLYLPISIAKFFAGIMEKRAKKTGEKPLLTTFSIYNLERNNTFDYSKAKKELGYRPRPYVETIKDEVRWLMKSGKVKSSLHYA
jgi:dihydroflavonol-4-reductase